MKKRFHKAVAIIFTVGIAASVTALQVVSPLVYFSALSHVSQYALREYTTRPSGYGVPEAAQFLRETIAGKPAYVAMALHSGNPESGVTITLLKDTNILFSYMDADHFQQIDTVECLSSDIPVYFISREDDLAGLNKFFRRIYFKKSQVSGTGIGIYTLKEPCVGRTMKLYAVET